MAEIEEAKVIKESKVRITYQNLDDAYIPEEGIEYEVAPGCIRTLKRNVYDVARKAHEIMQKENNQQYDPGADDYPEHVRLKCLEVITDGDPLPEGYAGVENDVVGRAVVDFFMLRIYKQRKLTS